MYIKTYLTADFSRDRFPITVRKKSLNPGESSSKFTPNLYRRLTFSFAKNYESDHFESNISDSHIIESRLTVEP